MTTPTPPLVTGPFRLGPLSQILPATYRFVGDDWDDDAAFVITFYTALPTFGPDGSVTSQGAVRDLTGCTLSGSIAYRPRSIATYPDSAVASVLRPMSGTINPANGQGTLTLQSSLTGFPAQDFSVWTPEVVGFEANSLLIVQARLTDSLGKTTTQGIIPLFVFGT